MWLSILVVSKSSCEDFSDENEGRGYIRKKPTLSKDKIGLHWNSVRDESRTHTAARPLPPQSSVSTNSTTRTWICKEQCFERKTGLEPATPTLARSCSTNWAIFAFWVVVGYSLLIQSISMYLILSEKRGSNPRPRPWQGRALPTELFSHILMFVLRLSGVVFSNAMQSYDLFLNWPNFWAKKLQEIFTVFCNLLNISEK